MSKTERVLDAACSQRRQMRVIIALLIAMALLLLFSLTTVRPGDDTFPLVVINAVLLVVTLTFFLGMYRYCTRREMGDGSVRED